MAQLIKLQNLNLNTISLEARRPRNLLSEALIHHEMWVPLVSVGSTPSWSTIMWNLLKICSSQACHCNNIVSKAEWAIHLWMLTSSSSWDIGINFDIKFSRPCSISLWMPCNHICQHINNIPKTITLCKVIEEKKITVVDLYCGDNLYWFPFMFTSMCILILQIKLTH